MGSFFVRAHCACCGEAVQDASGLSQQLSNVPYQQHGCFWADVCQDCKRCRLHCTCLAALKARIADLESQLAEPQKVA